MRFGLKQRFGFSQTGSGGATPPSFTVAPQITGTAVVGQTLTCDGGTATGTGPITKTYQWYRGASPIGGATNSTYTLVQADAGNTSNIKCTVTATNGAGSASADSNTVARILDVLANAYIGAEVITSGETDAVNQFYLSIRAQGWTTNIKRMNIYANINANLQLKQMFGGATCIAVNSPTFTRAVGSTQTGTSYINSNVNINSIGITRDSNLLYTRTANMTSATVLISGAFIGGVSLWIGRDATNVLSANFAVQAGGPAVSTNKQFSNRRQNSTTQENYSGATTQSFARTAVGSMMSGNAFDGARNIDGSPGNLMANGTILEAVAYCDGSVDPIVLDGIVSIFISSL